MPFARNASCVSVYRPVLRTLDVVERKGVM